MLLLLHSSKCSENRDSHIFPMLIYNPGLGYVAYVMSQVALPVAGPYLTVA